MNNGLNLATIAKELLIIQDDFQFYLKDPSKSRIENFEFETFTQVWGNTSGGFEEIGGSAITEQRTYVFIPRDFREDCYVYFGGRFGYSVPVSDIFLEDVKKHNIAGCKHREKYLKESKANKKLSEIIAEIEKVNGISDAYLHRECQTGNLQLNIEFDNEKSDTILEENNIKEIDSCAFWE